jgi:hypothetical protein
MSCSACALPSNVALLDVSGSCGGGSMGQWGVESSKNLVIIGSDRRLGRVGWGWGGGQGELELVGDSDALASGAQAAAETLIALVRRSLQVRMAC